MCRVKPGRRCAKYTAAHLRTAVGRVGSSQKEYAEARGTELEEPAARQLQDAQDSLVMATILNDATYENRRFLADRLEALEADDPARSVLSHRLLAASVYVEERSTAVKLMPDEKPATAEGAAAYEELGVQRERLSLMHAQATVSGDERWVEKAQRQEQAVYDAEVAFRIAEAGGEADQRHCEPDQNPNAPETVKESHEKATTETGAHPDRVARRRPRSRRRPKLQVLRAAQRMRRMIGIEIQRSRRIGGTLASEAERAKNAVVWDAPGEKLLDMGGVLPDPV
jgi:hypothetical protein